jgi:hypothetical protein
MRNKGRNHACLNSVRKIHTCDECGMSFRTDHALYYHLVDHVLCNPLACRVCFEILPSIDSLERHLLDHIQELQNN